MKQSTSFAQVATNLLNVLQGYTKTIRLLLVMLLTLTVSANAWGATYTLDQASLTTSKSPYQTSDYTHTATDGSKWVLNGYGIITTNPKHIQLGKASKNYIKTPTCTGNITEVSITFAKACSYYIAIWDMDGNIASSTIASEPAANSTKTFTISGEHKQLQIIGTKTSNGTSITTSNAAAYISSITITYETAASYTVTYNANGGSGTMSKSTGSSIKIKECTFTAPECKQFTSWNTAANGSGTLYAPNATVETNLTLYAQWEDLPLYTVKLMDNNEVLTSSCNTPITLPSREGCDGYEFAGWTKTWKEEQEEWTTTAPAIISAGSYTPTANVNLYPVYTKSEGGGSTSVLTKMGKGNTLLDGDKIVVVAKDNNIALYQETVSTSYVNKWDCSTLTAANVGNDDKKWWLVTTTNNGFYLGDATYGYLNMSSNYLYCNTTKSVWTLSDLNDGTFKLQSSGRNLSYRNDLSSNVYWRMGGANNGTSGQTVLEIYKFSEESSSTTYYISVPDCTTKATVTLDLDGGSFDSKPDGWEEDGNNYTKTINSGDQVTLPEPNKTGHDFEGWYNASTKVTSPYTLTGNTTLTAHWTPQTYDITYKDQGNATFSGSHESGNPTQHTYGTATTLKGATKTGYTFGGWYKEAACTNIVTSLGATEYTANITLYAKWTVNSYTVTWDPNGGNWGGSAENKVDTYEYGAAITKPTDPTLEGYRFDGWGDVAGTMPANNLEYTAQWTKVYTITWNENGVPSYTYVPSDNAVVTWEDNIADCGEKKFYGWTADGTFVSDPTTPPTLISKGTTIAGDVTYYAVYADAEEPANPGYTKVTTISEGTYLIATDNTANKAYTGRSGTNTYGGYCTVEIVDDVISDSKSALEVEITLNGSNFYMHDGTYYLGYTSGNAMTFDASIQTGNQNRWKLTADGYIESVNVTGRILQYNSGSPRFACYSSDQKKAYLYKKQTTTYANFAVSCATYTITVEPDDGTVTTTPADEAGQGQTITVNITPADCKYLTALKYNDGSDHSINIASTPYTFTMPAADVTVTATFADKTATNIEVVTSTHRMLMQGSSFVGEQVRITYNNGDAETLNWNDSRLTFSGYNTANLGSQTVTVTFNGCGTQTTSYNIEVIDGLGITFWDGDYTETIKYEPGDLVDVDNKIGQNICSGWEFVGWSETKVANESNGFTPVHNINATEPRTLYAVYVQTSTDWISAYNIDELHPGAKYVIVAHYSDGKEFALTNTNNTSSSYLDGANLTTDCETVREGDAYPYKDRYKLKVTPQLSWKWQLVNTGSGWTMRNISANKYLKVNSDKTISLTATPDDKFTLDNGSNDSEITAQSSSNNYLSWYNSSKYWNGHTSGQQYYLTNETNFTSTPPCSPLSATFHGNGGTVIAAGGSPTDDDLTITEPTRDAGITTPTAAFADCNGKSWTFVGWSDKEVDVTRVPVLTTDLLHDGGGNKPYKIQEDGEEFWAVYTNQGNPETLYGTITFTQEDWGTSYSTGTKTKTVGGIDYSFSYERLCKASTQGIQFEEIEGKFANATSLGKINSIRFGKFNRGDIDDLKVYVGKTADNVTTALTAADLQVVENTYTYYPSADYAFFKVVSVGDVCYVEEITIDYGQPTKVWATTPDCSIIRILTNEEVYVTATKDRGIMATAPLTIKTQQLDASADVVITSTSSDVYFSATRDANFAKAAANQPKTSLTLNADADGNLQQDIYVHYKPSAEGDGTPASVVVSANLAIPNPSVTDDQTIYVRNLPAKFVIATKVGATWYALPANMNGATNPEGVVIDVDETHMTAIAPNTASYTLFPVKTTNGEYDRYATNTTHYGGDAYGDRVRFAAVNNGNKGLWATSNGNTINNNAKIESVSNGGTSENTNPSYEWKISTTIVNGNWQYTLQTDQPNNQKYLRYWAGASGAPKWGTYAAGNNQLYFLPVTETEPFDYKVVEWYPTKMLIQTDATITNPTAEIGDAPINNVTCTNKGSKLYEIAGLPLESNPTKVLTIKFSDGGNNYTNATAIPVIISQSATTVSSAPFTTLTKDVYNYADLVVRDGATLTVDGGTHAENTFFNVTIYPTSKISVPSDKKLTVHSLTFFGGIDEIYNGSTYTLNKYGVPELSLKGTLYKSIAKMDYVMRVDLDQMYSLTVPYDVQLADIKYWDGSDIALGDALYVSAYDGEARANQSKKTWIYETDFNPATLKAGVGYTISAELQDGVGSEYSILRMPMNSNIANDATEAAKTVAVTAWGIDANITDNHKGWNLVGNPYMTAISGGEADTKLVLGYLKETGTGPWEWVEKTYRYVTIPADNGKDYSQQKFTEAVLPPFKNFFVQVGTTGELVFDLGTRQSMPARSTQAAIEKEVEFEILMSNDARQDNTGLLISEEYSPAYEINADLEKMIGSMSVYTIYGGYKLAYNALSPINASEWIPMGYVAPAAGEYTFRLDDVEKIVEQVEHVYVIDYDANNIVDLMTDEYKFTTNKEQNDNRFAINVVLIQDKDNTTTGLDIINGNNTAPIKFIYHDKIYIKSGEVIYDGTGKQVTNINK